MGQIKRLVIATISGVLFGFICLGFASSGSEPLPMAVTLQIVFSRTLIGFVIGISCFPVLHWSLHGLLMGMLVSLPLAFSGLMAPENPEFTKISMFIWTVILGMVYGLLIEVITSVLFKAKRAMK